MKSTSTVDIWSICMSIYTVIKTATGIYSDRFIHPWKFDVFQNNVLLLVMYSVLLNLVSTVHVITGLSVMIN